MGNCGSVPSYRGAIKQLHAAIGRNDVVAVVDLLRTQPRALARAPLRDAGVGGLTCAWPPLHRAASCGHYKLVALLLQVSDRRAAPLLQGTVLISSTMRHGH